MARLRGVFWAGVLAALVLIGAGVATIVVYRPDSGPDATVRDYFAALADGDADAALGYGPVPAGTRAWLTDAVLADQRQLAPISGVGITKVTRHGDVAHVGYVYYLGFDGGTQQVTGTLRVVRTDGHWRLPAVAVRVSLQLDGAADRASLADAAMPSGPILLFPGAIPVLFHPGVLQLSPSTGDVRFGDSGRLALQPMVSPAARVRLDGEITAMLKTCSKGGSSVAAAACPLPNDRYVPSSLHGSVDPASIKALGYSVGSASRGIVRVNGDVTFHGSYRHLDFDDLAHARHGQLSLVVDATADATSQLRLHWVLAP